MAPLRRTAPAWAPRSYPSLIAHGVPKIRKENSEMGNENLTYKIYELYSRPLELKDFRLSSHKKNLSKIASRIVVQWKPFVMTERKLTEVELVRLNVVGLIAFCWVLFGLTQGFIGPMEFSIEWHRFHEASIELVFLYVDVSQCAAGGGSVSRRDWQRRQRWRRRGKVRSAPVAERQCLIRTPTSRSLLQRLNSPTVSYHDTSSHWYRKPPSEVRRPSRKKITLTARNLVENK